MLVLYFGKQKPRKNYLYFRKQNFLYFRKRKPPENFLYFRKHDYLLFQEVTFRAQKAKEDSPRKKFLIFQQMEVSTSKNLNKTPFWTGYLTNHWTLLVAQASSFLIHHLSLIYPLSLTQIVRLPWLPTTGAALVLVTGGYATSLVIKCSLPNPRLLKQKISLGVENILTMCPAHIANSLSIKRIYLVGSFYLLGAATGYYINHLLLVLNSLYY